MSVDYRLFSTIQCKNKKYYADVVEKRCPLAQLVSALNKESNKWFLWLEADASMGKTTSTILLQYNLETSNECCYRFQLKQINYDQTEGLDITKKHLVDCMERIASLGSNAIVIFDGYDELRNDLKTLENANKCIMQALTKCKVIVTTRSLEHRPSFVGCSPTVANILPLSADQIEQYLGDESAINELDDDSLLRNVMCLKMYRELLDKGVSIALNKRLTEAWLIDQYLLNMYLDKGNVDETNVGKKRLYEQNIHMIGEAVYYDLKMSDRVIYQQNESEKYSLEKAFIPHPLNTIFSYTDFGAVDSSQILFLHFALARYIFDEFRSMEKKYGKTKELPPKIVEFTQELKNQSGYYAFLMAGELMAESETDFDEKYIVDVLRQSDNIYSNSNATYFCLGYNEKIYDNIYGENWGRNSLKWFKEHHEEPDLVDRATTEAYMRLKDLPGEYTGEELDGERHGHGLYRWSNDVWYEGDYFHGKRQGKGTMHYPDGYYIGDWVNGIEQGKGKYCFNNGDIYEGDFLDGDIEGNGVYIWHGDGSKYIGEWKHNQRHGKGIMFYSDKDWYEGQWSEGAENGIGTRHFDNGDIYVGEWQQGSLTGKGKYTSESDKYTYEGNFLNFLMHGYGKKVLPNGDVYEGEFVEDRVCGKGRYTCSDDGSWFYGDWKNDVRVYGEMHFATNNFAQYHIGEYQNGKINGHGVLFDHGERIYEGEFVDGKAQGQGTYYFDDGSYYEGSFANNNFHGLGVLHDSDGTITKGVWNNGELIEE